MPNGKVPLLKWDMAQRFHFYLCKCNNIWLYSRAIYWIAIYWMRHDFPKSFNKITATYCWIICDQLLSNPPFGECWNSVCTSRSSQKKVGKKLARQSSCVNPSLPIVCLVVLNLVQNQSVCRDTLLLLTRGLVLLLIAYIHPATFYF